ncbi:MAG: helix-turn-helix domain-containing protein [Shimia sp.]
MERALAVHHGIFGRIAIYRFASSMVSHAHREAHLTFLLEGPDSKMPVAGRPGPLDQDTVIACSPWVPHAFDSGSKVDPSMFLVLYVSPHWFQDWSRDVKPGVRFGTHLFFRTQKIRGYVAKLANLLFIGDHSDLIEGYIYELTQECHDESWRRADARTEAIASAGMVGDYRIRRSIETMKTHIGSTQAVEAIADESGLSRPHFFKLFRDQTGLTPNVYLNTLRVESALSSLGDTKVPICTISDGLGFSSQASFTRFFTSHVGVPPREYRQVAAF